MKKMKVETRIIDGARVDGKVCTMCLTWKPLDAAFCANNRGTGNKQAECKDCYRQRVGSIKKYGKTEDILVVESGTEVKYKQCSRCGELKPLSCYALQKNGHDGRRPHCKSCQAVENAKWQKNNPLAVKVLSHRHRTKRLSLPSDFTTDDAESTFLYFGNMCALTGEECRIDWDHVIPVSTGCGGTTKSNMLPISSILNQSKNGRNIFEWFDDVKDKYDLNVDMFRKAMQYISELNEMTVDEYRDYVDECFDALPNY